MSRWVPPMILAASAAVGCSVSFESLSFDRSPDGGATTGSGGSGGATTTASTSTTGGNGGATTTSTSTTTTTTGGTGGHVCPAESPLSDDFSSASTLANWQLLSTVEGVAPVHDLLDIDTTTPGQLTMRPMPTAMNGWYGTLHAPFLFKEVTGNFLIAARVSAGVLAGPNVAPVRTFNTAGLMARSPTPGASNWVLIDVGFQDPSDAAINHLGLGALGKSTINGTTTRTPLPGDHQGWLGICRIGSTFGLVHKLDGEPSATILQQLERPDLGATLQVGVVVGSWVANERDVFGRFDAVRFSVPETPLDCEACLLE